MTTRREEQLSRRHASWTPEQVASLLAEYREDMACAALKASLHAVRENHSYECCECGQTNEVWGQSGARPLLEFAEWCRRGDMFDDGSQS